METFACALLKKLSQEGITILHIEQNANAALHAAHIGYVMETGNITLQGSSAERLASPQVQEAYLGKTGKYKQ